jgi:two-component system chemotaxis response regulator CheY
MHVLIIDDSRAMRRILKSVAHRLGFETSEAEDGLIGLEMLRATSDVELVLVDWNMPNMDGLQFVEAVRSDDAFKNTKIVMVTSETEPSKMVRVLMAGADEFVMKPFTTEILVSKLKLIGVPIALAAG